MNSTLNPFNKKTTLLSMSIIIDEIEIKENSKVSYHNNGNIASVLLTEDTLAKGFLFKKNTFLVFYPTQKIQYGTLARDEIRTITGIRASVMVKFKSDTNLWFHSDGSISQGINLFNDGLMHPYNFHLTEGPIIFDGSGQLILCKSSQNLKLVSENGNEAYTDANHTISLSNDYDNPSITKAFFNNNYKWNNYHIKGGKEIMFYRGESMERPGQILLFTSLYNMFKDDFFISKNEPIVLYENNKLKRFSISNEITINGINLKPNTTIIELYPNQKLREIFSSWEITINDTKYKPWTNIHFNENGDVIE